MKCAQFLEELNDFLDEAVDGVSRADLERHLSKCPDCRLIWDTTKQTVRIFKGLEPCAIPRELELRLLAAVKKKASARCFMNIREREAPFTRATPAGCTSFLR